MAAGCGEGASPPSHADGPSLDEDACPSFVVPQRMGFRWNKLNHRVSLWSLRLARPDDTCRADALESGCIGGNFSTGEGIGVEDNPSLRYGFQLHDSPEPRPLGAAHRTFEATIDSDGIVEKTVTLQRDALELEHYDRIVPLLGGWEFETDVEPSDDYPDDYDPARGYTMAGIGASVEALDVTETEVQLRYRLRFRPGASDDRIEHNRAVPRARIGAELDVLLIGAPSNRVRTGSTSYELAYETPEPREEPLARAPPEQTRIALSGQSGGPRGIWGLQSFDFQFDAELTCNRDGDCPDGDSCRLETSSCRETYGPPGFYLRELSAALSLRDYDRSSGRAIFDFDGFASNTSDFVSYYPLHSTFTGRMAWFQVEGSADPVRGERSVETGRTSFELDALK